jgi:HAE1 family hydrophobic/amphiphilic exporter-1
VFGFSRGAYTARSLVGMIGTEFVPDEDRSEFHVLVDLPPGTSFDESVAQVSRIEQVLGRVPEAIQVFSTVGVQGDIRSSDIQVRLTPKDTRKRAIADIKAGVRGEMAKIPFADIRVTKPQFMQGAPNQPPIEIFVRGDNLQELQRISDELTTKLKQIPGAVDIPRLQFGPLAQFL